MPLATSIYSWVPRSAPRGNQGISASAEPGTGKQTPRPGWKFRAKIFLWLAACLGTIASALGAPAQVSEFAAAARKALNEARAKHEKQPENAELTWQFARACFVAGEFATNNTERAELAERGIAASQELAVRQTNSAPAHYYLAMNLGQLARTKGLSALRLVSQMEKEFLLARGLDPRFDHAGPDRNLGLLYRDAPAIGSIGSRTKAKLHLIRATELAPEYPDNRLSLVEAYAGWNDKNNARKELKALESGLPAARTNLSGPAWAPSWIDWEQRIQSLKVALEEPPKTSSPARGKH